MLSVPPYRCAHCLERKPRSSVSGVVSLLAWMPAGGVSWALVDVVRVMAARSVAFRCTSPVLSGARVLAADSAGTQRPDVVADLFQCGRERGELGLV